MGAVGFFGASIQNAIALATENRIEIELLKKDIQSVLQDLHGTISDIGSMGATVKMLELTTTKLDVIVERLER